MNRRGFLKALAAAPAVAAPNVSNALVAIPQAGGALDAGVGWGGVVGWAGAAANGAGALPTTSLLGTAMWVLHDQFDAVERAREAWLWEWRQHRIRVRRGKEPATSARVIWLRRDLLLKRRVASWRAWKDTPQPSRKPWSNRKARRREARIRTLMRAHGYKGLPWAREA